MRTSEMCEYQSKRVFDKCRVTLDILYIFAIIEIMKIRNVRHKGLRRFIENDDAAGLPAQYIGKIRNIIAFLQDMNSEEEVKSISTWKAHQLTGDRKGTWSLFVSRNWRITFAVNNDEIEIIDLDFEDYH